MASQSLVNSVSPASVEAATKITRGHSCILCQQRKVKCDRQKPCANCVKARAECIVATPSNPRRRRKKLTESDLVLRLRRYEHLLKANGIKVEPEDIYPEHEQSPNISSEIDVNDIRRLNLNVPRPPDEKSSGMWFFSKDRSAQFVENTLWESMKDEIEEFADSSSDDNANDVDELPPGEAVLISFNEGATDLLAFHPPVAHIFRLWQIFLENVNPLVKMFHAPTVQQMITAASSNLETISKPNEALLFSIYFVSVLSLTAQECEEYFGEDQQKLLIRYCRAVQLALVNAKLLRTMNLTTLQAFVIYMLAGRRLYDPHTIWSLSGLAVRIAQRLGIHTDEGTAKFPPFEAEIRRRTWWQLVFLEGHSSKLAGAAFPIWITKYDCKLPANLSDSELSPSMSELPASKEGLSEMMMCSMRHETIKLLRQAPLFQKKNEDGTFRDCTTAELIELKDAAVDNVQKIIHEKFIQYCDPSIPIQFVMIVMAKSVVSTMRVMAHHPRNYPDKGASMPQKEKDLLFHECLTDLDVQILGHETKLIQRFLWHNHVYFQYDAFIYLLSELQIRTRGPLVDKAWAGVEKVYHHRPELITDTKNVLFVAIGSLTLKAWAKREEALNMYHAMPPRFISLIRAQKNGSQSKSSTQSPQTNPSMDFTNIPPTVIEQRDNFSFIPPTTSDQMIIWGDTSMDYNVDANYSVPIPGVPLPDWEYWQNLMDGGIPSHMVDPSMRQDWM